jgi:DNA polymerase-3 subunit delta
MPPRFYLLHGPDEFASAEFVAQLKAQMGDPSMASLNTTLFDGRTVTLADLIGACNAMPFLTERRLVIVEGWLTKLLSKTEDGEGEAHAPAHSSAKETLASLTDYLKEQPDTTCLVLLEKRELPERHAVLKTVAGQDWAQVKFFDLPKGEALVKWIRARARQAGGEFTRDAAQALAEADNDPRALDHEILKLLTYVNFARAVEPADVEQLTPAGGEANIFNLVDALGQRQGSTALRELHQVLEKQEPLYVLGMIVRQFRLLLLTKELLDSRVTEAEVARTLGLHPYPAGKLCKQARNFSLSSLELIYRRLLECDLDIKTGRAEAAAVLDTLVVGLTTSQN